MSHIIVEALNSYVSQKGKSISQVAYHLDISKSHLSEIKNEKKMASLDLGLRILNFTKASDEKKRDWIETSRSKISKNYEHLIQTETADRKKVHLKESLSQLMAENLDLLLIFMDILNNGVAGVSRIRIAEEYGQRNLIEVLRLVEMNYLTMNDDKLTLGPDVRVVLDKQSSHSLMKTVFEELKKQDQLQNNQSQFQFEIDDISDEGAEELKRIHKEAMEKAAQVFKQHSLKRSQGGKRFIFQVLSARLQNSLKTIAVILFCMSLFSGQQLWAGGIEGGGSTGRLMISDGIEGGASSLVIPNFLSREDAHEFGLIFSEKIKKGQSDLDFQEKADSNCRVPGWENQRAEITPLKLRVLPKFELNGNIQKYETRIEYEVRCRAKHK